jgi:hypothetical protein
MRNYKILLKRCAGDALLAMQAASPVIFIKILDFFSHFLYNGDAYGIASLDQKMRLASPG